MNFKVVISKLVSFLILAATVNILACSNARFGANGITGPKNGVVTNGTNQVTSGVNQIQVNNSGAIITWSRANNNIYVAAANNCIKGLATNADDINVKNKAAELASLIDTSTIGRGVLSQPGANSIYLTLSYDNGQTRRFNLRNSVASSSEDTLSKGSQIIDFFDDVNSDIQNYGVVSCNNGKK